MGKPAIYNIHGLGIYLVQTYILGADLCGLDLTFRLQFVHADVKTPH